jgi:peptide/nickel transport system substrate-binding protein
MIVNGKRDEDRISRIQGLMSICQNRRNVLKTAAAAGLIPVLTAADVRQRQAFSKQTPAPVQGGTFIMLSQAPIDALSPENSGGGVQFATVSNILDPLFVVNELYELEPVLAQSHELSEDGLTYTFHLNSGVTFHNGDSFTAEDVVYTFNWIMDEENASIYAADFDLVESVEAPDEQTVVVTLSDIDVTFLVNVGTTLIYPKDYHAEVGAEAFTSEPVGTGPFIPQEYNPDQRVVMAANENYFRGRPNVDIFQVDVVSEAAGRTAALESGQADASFWYLNAEDNIRLMESGEFTVYEVLQVTVNHFPLNVTHPFLSDVAVRRALLHAIDRQAFAEEIFLGQAQVAHHNLSPAIEKYYNDDVVKYEFDPEKAKSLLDEAGWVEGSDGIREKDGVRAAFTMMVFQGDTQRRPEAEVAQQWWSDIGVECTLQEGITSDVLAGLREGTYDAGLFNWVYGGTSGDPDARTSLATGAVNNFFQYSNEEVDRLLQEGAQELDEAARIEKYKRIQEIVAEELPFLPLLTPQQIVFFAQRVKGLPEDAVYPDAIYQKVYTLWLEE